MTGCITKSIEFSRLSRKNIQAKSRLGTTKTAFVISLAANFLAIFDDLR